MAMPEMRDATRVAAQLLGRLIAEDTELLRARVREDRGVNADERHFVEVADTLLCTLERLDVGADEELDRDREQLQHGPGEVWLRVAESGRMDKEYVNHVLAHLGQADAGAVGPPAVRLLLLSIGHMDDLDRDAAALAFPEYVGLMRAFDDNVPNAVARMRAVVER